MPDKILYVRPAGESSPNENPCLEHSLSEEMSMRSLLTQFPFTFALAFVAAAGSSWFGWSWGAILLSTFAGLFIGAVIDQTRKESGGQ